MPDVISLCDSSDDDDKNNNNDKRPRTIDQSETTKTTTGRKKNLVSSSTTNKAVFFCASSASNSSSMVIDLVDDDSDVDDRIGSTKLVITDDKKTTPQQTKTTTITKQPTRQHEIKAKVQTSKRKYEVKKKYNKTSFSTKFHDQTTINNTTRHNNKQGELYNNNYNNNNNNSSDSDSDDSILCFESGFSKKVNATPLRSSPAKEITKIPAVARRAVEVNPLLQQQEVIDKTTTTGTTCLRGIETQMDASVVEKHTYPITPQTPYIDDNKNNNDNQYSTNNDTATTTSTWVRNPYMSKIASTKSANKNVEHSKSNSTDSQQHSPTMESPSTNLITPRNPYKRKFQSANNATQTTTTTTTTSSRLSSTAIDRNTTNKKKIIYPKLLRNAKPFEDIRAKCILALWKYGRTLVHHSKDRVQLDQTTKKIVALSLCEYPIRSLEEYCSRYLNAKSYSSSSSSSSSFSITVRDILKTQLEKGGFGKTQTPVDACRNGRYYSIAEACLVAILSEVERRLRIVSNSSNTNSSGETGGTNAASKHLQQPNTPQSRTQLPQPQVLERRLVRIGATTTKMSNISSTSSIPSGQKRGSGSNTIGTNQNDNTSSTNRNTTINTQTQQHQHQHQHQHQRQTLTELLAKQDMWISFASLIPEIDKRLQNECPGRLIRNDHTDLGEEYFLDKSTKSIEYKQLDKLFSYIDPKEWTYIDTSTRNNNNQNNNPSTDVREEIIKGGVLIKKHFRKGKLFFELTPRGFITAQRIRQREFPSPPGHYRCSNLDAVEPKYLDICLCVDQREGGGGSKMLHSMCNKLDDRKIPYVVGHLMIGDYAFFSGDKLCPFLVERKSIQDIALSIHDGRWNSQKRRMYYGQYVFGYDNSRIAFIIEGKEETQQVTGGYIGHRMYNVNRRRLDEEIENLKSEGFEVLRTSSPEHSMYELTRWAERVAEELRTGKLGIKYTYQQFKEQVQRIPSGTDFSRLAKYAKATREEKGATSSDATSGTTVTATRERSYSPFAGNAHGVEDKDSDIEVLDLSSSPETTPSSNVQEHILPSKKAKSSHHDSPPVRFARGSPSNLLSPHRAENGCEARAVDYTDWSLTQLRDKCVEYGLVKSGSRKILVERLNGPRPPKVWLQRKMKGEYVPSRYDCCATALLVALYLHERENSNSTDGLTKEELYTRAEELEISKNPFSGGTTQTGPYHYDGWSSMSQLLNGDPPLIMKKKGKFKLTRSCGISGFPLADGLHAWCHQHDKCKCLVI